MNHSNKQAIRIADNLPGNQEALRCTPGRHRARGGDAGTGEESSSGGLPATELIEFTSIPLRCFREILKSLQ